MTSIHDFRERYIKKKLGIVDVSNSPLNTPTINNIRNEEPPEKSDKPQPWSPPIYSSIKEFNEDLPNLLDSLNDDDDSIEYGSRKAILNLRKLFQNIGLLYVEKIFTE